jgi:ferric-dicitrate binding protein FerR (iron transport regulator)
VEEYPDKYDINELAEKLAKGTISKEESAYFERWYADFNDEEVRVGRERHGSEEALRTSMLSGIYRKIDARSGRHNRRSSLYTLVKAAAAVLLLIGAAYFFHYRKTPTPRLAQSDIQDIAPGGNKATLTLANGATIILNDVHKGQVASQGNSKIIKVNNGLVAYHTAASGGEAPGVAYNTLTVPRGGQFKLVLADGTRVWLNSASSIRYPTAFTGADRTVRITGEAYFEVAKNSLQPFRVLADRMTVSVLGTHFNIMAYPDEPAAKVTLLEGAVNVKSKGNTVRLKPGEQLLLDPSGGMRTVDGINLQGVISWTHDQFWLNGGDIHTIMREISRWYNVDVVIKGNIPEHFEGYIPRDVNVSKIFEVLQQTNLLDYTIQNNKIIVSP